jgi:hypothetical protein
MSLPARLIVPDWIGTRPAIDLISVDFPAPFGPSTTTISPADTTIEAPLTIGTPGS